jgi:PAS domain S-box-containing protein
LERELAERERERLAREQLLRAARLRLAAIVESSSDAIIGKDLDGIITDWNKGAERIYGYTAEEMIGKSVSILTPPERPDEISQIMERIRRGEQVEHYETVRVTKTGKPIQVSLTVSPIRDEFGNTIGASTAARDITERKRTEDERERLVTELQAALAKVKLLSGFLPICAACKKIRNDQGYWEQVEIYIRDHSEAEFSHGLCPNCIRRFYPDPQRATPGALSVASEGTAGNHAIEDRSDEGPGAHK